MKRFLLFTLLLVASCAGKEEQLQRGTYNASAHYGVITVEILEKGNCNISMTGSADVFSGTYDCSSDGTIRIKGYTSRPDAAAEPGTITEKWSDIYTFTGSTGEILSATSFSYYIKRQAPLDKTEGETVTFVKR